MSVPTGQRDRAKVLYHEKLKCDATAPPPSLESTSGPRPTTSAELPIGWALRSSKNAIRFREAQRNYLESKFKVGEDIGLKLDPGKVARDMRYARNAEGQKDFSADEFLTAQQVQSFFSRRASKQRHSNEHESGQEVEQNDDLMAAEEEISGENVRSLVFKEVALTHLIVYDIFNLCDMYSSSKLQKLNISMLRTICEHFDIQTGSIKGRRKAPYLSLLGGLIKTCDCCSANT